MQTYIIAEIGQNHNGDLNIAKKLIDIAAMPIFDYFSGERLVGVDAVKFTKRDLDEELSCEAAEQPYISPHAFGPTYLAHRRALELTDEQHKELESYAHAQGLQFVETLCSPGCLMLLGKMNIDRIKIASRDITNIPLLERVAESEHPHIILSTGMCSLPELEKAIQILNRPDRGISILHCISQYPATYENINLRAIHHLKKIFPEFEIGYSDHSIGVLVPALAVAFGATTIEKHITLNRNMKGSDHAGSLEPEGLWRMVRDIRNTEKSLGLEEKKYNTIVDQVRVRLARSLALKEPLSTGETLLENHLCMLSPGNGLQWEDRLKIIGKKACRELAAHSLLKIEDFVEIKQNASF